MRPSLLLTLLLAPNAFAQPKAKNPNIADTPALAPADQIKAMKLPPGFEIQLVAAEPKVKKPINIAFDARGRLWVTESVEYPFAAPKGRKGKDSVKILEDFGPDGQARKITTFADDLNIPIGVLPLGDGSRALVYSIPNIYLMTDADGDGVADKREVLYSQYGFKDTHGMTGEFMHGFDGWVYCCHGFSNTSSVKSKGTDSLAMTSGNTYRIKPDGSRIEIFTHGQVNPFGLAFDSLGNLYSADCHTRPLYQLLRGAVYPGFGKPHDGLGFGPEMVTHTHGSTAISGVAVYADDRFPKEFHDNLFVGNVVTNRINRDRVEWIGATPKGIEMPDLVVSSDPWFRPVDIKLGPDGALYVADFYNRIIGHYEVPLDHPGRDREKGRIWRIVYTGKDLPDRGPVQIQLDVLPKQIADAKNIDRLRMYFASPNLTQRMLALELLVDRGRKDQPSQHAKMAVFPRILTCLLRLSSVQSMLLLKKAVFLTVFHVERAGRKDPVAAVKEMGDLRVIFNHFQDVHELWAIHRLGQMKGIWLETALASKAPMVRVHALRVMGEMPEFQARHRQLATAALEDPDAHVRRAAAALPPHAFNSIEPLVKLRHRVPVGDTHLLHTVRMAIRDYLVQNPSVVDHAWNEKDSAAIADVCPGVRKPHGAAFLIKHFKTYPVTFKTLVPYTHTIYRDGTDPKDRAWFLEHMREAYKADPALQAQLFKAMLQATQERGGKLGSEYRPLALALAERLVNTGTPAQIGEGVELASVWKLAEVMPAILKLAQQPAISDAQRKAAIQALVAVDLDRHLPALLTILSSETEAAAVRDQVGQALAGQNDPKVQAALIEAFQKSPARLQTVIALGLAGSRQGSDKLLEAVEKGKASARLLQNPAIDLRLRQAKIPRFDERLKTLTAGLPPANQQMLETISKRSAGFELATRNPELGKNLFAKHCGVCHQIANQGAKLGPQLDGVGIRGKERLLEDILDPNRNVDQAFRATTLVLKTGQTHVGLLLREEGQVVVLGDSQGKEQRIEKKLIDERLATQFSPMPANVLEVIAEADFYHLLAYLLEQRLK